MILYVLLCLPPHTTVSGQAPSAASIGTEAVNMAGTPPLAKRRRSGKTIVVDSLTEAAGAYTIPSGTRSTLTEEARIPAASEGASNHDLLDSDPDPGALPLPVARQRDKGKGRATRDSSPEDGDGGASDSQEDDDDLDLLDASDEENPREEDEPKEEDEEQEEEEEEEKAEAEEGEVDEGIRPEYERDDDGYASVPSSSMLLAAAR